MGASLTIPKHHTRPCGKVWRCSCILKICVATVREAERTCLLKLADLLIQVSYGEDGASQLARQAFLQSLVTNASQVFQSSTFASTYGLPQVPRFKNSDHCRETRNAGRLEIILMRTENYPRCLCINPLHVRETGEIWPGNGSFVNNLALRSKGVSPHNSQAGLEPHTSFRSPPTPLSTSLVFIDKFSVGRGTEREYIRVQIIEGLQF